MDSLNPLAVHLVHCLNSLAMRRHENETAVVSNGLTAKLTGDAQVHPAATGEWNARRHQS